MIILSIYLSIGFCQGGLDRSMDWREWPRCDIEETLESGLCT